MGRFRLSHRKTGRRKPTLRNKDKEHIDAHNEAKEEERAKEEVEKSREAEKVIEADKKKEIDKEVKKTNGYKVSEDVVKKSLSKNTVIIEDKRGKEEIDDDDDDDEEEEEDEGEEEEVVTKKSRQGRPSTKNTIEHKIGKEEEDEDVSPNITNGRSSGKNNEKNRKEYDEFMRFNGTEKIISAGTFFKDLMNEFAQTDPGAEWGASLSLDERAKRDKEIEALVTNIEIQGRKNWSGELAFPKEWKGSNYKESENNTAKTKSIAPTGDEARVAKALADLAVGDKAKDINAPMKVKLIESFNGIMDPTRNGFTAKICDTRLIEEAIFLKESNNRDALYSFYVTVEKKLNEDPDFIAPSNEYKKEVQKGYRMYPQGAVKNPKTHKYLQRGPEEKNIGIYDKVLSEKNIDDGFVQSTVGKEQELPNRRFIKVYEHSVRRIPKLPMHMPPGKVATVQEQLLLSPLGQHYYKELQKIFPHFNPARAKILDYIEKKEDLRFVRSTDEEEKWKFIEKDPMYFPAVYARLDPPNLENDDPEAPDLYLEARLRVGIVSHSKRIPPNCLVDTISRMFYRAENPREKVKQWFSCGLGDNILLLIPGQNCLLVGYTFHGYVFKFGVKEMETVFWLNNKVAINDKAYKNKTISEEAYEKEKKILSDKLKILKGSIKICLYRIFTWAVMFFHTIIFPRHDEHTGAYRYGGKTMHNIKAMKEYHHDFHLDAERSLIIAIARYERKSYEYGRTLLLIDERSSHRLCGYCGHFALDYAGTVEALCSHCGETMDRDANTARNAMIKMIIENDIGCYYRDVEARATFHKLGCEV